jgi:elongation factor Ts
VGEQFLGLFLLKEGIIKIMEISAKDVKELRERTGAGMMECKKALVEAKGNIEEAITILRKRGLASAAKKAGRVTAEGLVDVRVASVQGTTIGVIVEVNCETDFVARTEDFKGFVSQVGEHLLQQKADSLDHLLSQKFHPEEIKTVQEILLEKIAHIKENLSIRRFERMELNGQGALGTYIHAGGKIGVLVELGAAGGTNTAGEVFQGLVHDVAMHVAASDPKYLSRHHVPSSVLEREKDIARAKVPPGKQALVVDKIVEGQLAKFYGEVCLLEQPFVKEPGMSVGQWLVQKAPALGGAVEVRRFIRFKAGEGIEKPPDDFAAEVAAQLK